MISALKKYKDILILALITVLIASSVCLVFALGRREKLPYYDEMTAAAEKFSDVTKAVKAERLSRGIPLGEEDTLQIGLLGSDYTDITTTPGAVDAKRTSQTPDMAALVVRLIHEAGLKPGDRLGACFSGSFPGLNLAVICAAETTGVELCCTVSIGASTYGANQPGFTAPEMIFTAYDAGLIKTLPVSVSVGGEHDRGENMVGYIWDEREVMDETIARVKEKTASYGIPFAEHPEIADNVAYHAGLYGEINSFANVGGSVVGSGHNYAVLDMGQGVIRRTDFRANDESGLLEYYLHQGLPVIQLLNVKQLCLEYDITFDPSAIPEIGTQGLYQAKSYPRGAIIAVGCLDVILLAGYALYKKKQCDKS